MTQLILKNDLEPLQQLILIYLFRTWKVEVEFRDSDAPANVVQEPASAYTATAAEANTDVDMDMDTETDTGKPHVLFSESFGMWKDRDIDAKELRRQAWGYERRTKYYDTV
jgi:hypothetical protein